MSEDNLANLLSQKMGRRSFVKYLSAFLAAAAIPLEAAPIESPVLISGAGDVSLGNKFDDVFKSVSKASGLESALYYPFKNVSDCFRKSDITIVNFEGTLTKSSEKRKKGSGQIFYHKGDPIYADCLRKADIQLVNLANNHFMDYGDVGALDTIDAMEKNEVFYSGGGRNKEDASSVRIVERNGLKIAFLGYARVGASDAARVDSPGTNPFQEQKVKEEIKKARELADIVVVSCHWGNEYQYEPIPAQRYAAKLMVDAGADIIFGHHPHVLQNVEEVSVNRRKAVVFYSLGNFAFGANFYPSDRNSMIATVECAPSGVIGYKTIPVITHPAPGVIQPQLAQSE